jgi:uncharacterized protein YndB with AHSA1/START domain
MNSADTKFKLEVTTPSDREIVMTRAFDAPRRLVFDAFTKPELIQRWLLGPDGWSMPVCEVDLRPGGAFHYVWRNDADGQEFGLSGVYREITAPDRILHVERFDEPMPSSDALITTTFVGSGGATTVTLTCLYDTREIRDMALESGMDEGVARSYERLAEILSLRANE